MNLKALIPAMIFFLICDALIAQSLPLQSVNKAGEVIDAALAAHGGEEAIANVKTLVQKSDFTNFATGQSRKPGPPYDQNQAHNNNAIDLENEVFFTQNSGSGGGFDFDTGTIINGENSWQLDYRAGTAAPLIEPDYNVQSGPFIRVTPVLLMKQLQARRAQSNWLGEAEVNGRMHDVITLIMEVGPALALYFDQETHMLTRMERALPPFGQVEYRFEDYTLVDGIAFNQRFELYINGAQNLIIDVLQTELNSSIGKYTQVPANLRKVAAIPPDNMSTNEVREGVFLIGANGTYALFVEMTDYVVAVGGTQIVADSIREMRTEIPDKPIRYGVLTHHHNDHIPGAAAYAAEGASIVTFSENESVVRTAAGDENVKLMFVEDHMTLGEEGQSVELYNIGPTPHAENLLIAYLPDTGIVFEADHFPQPRNGIIPPAVPATVAFAKALDRLELEYRIILGAHSPRVGNPADLQSALDQLNPAP